MLLVDEMSIQTWIFTKNKDQIKYDKKMYVIIFIWSCLLRVTIHIDSISITVSFILRKRFHILFYDIFRHLKSAEHEIVIIDNLSRLIDFYDIIQAWNIRIR